MINKVGLFHLFGQNKKAIDLFLSWLKDDESISEYDYENVCVALALGAIDNTPRFFHFHTGNILDFLESQGYYIGLPLRGKYKYVTCCYFKEGGFDVVGRPFYNNSGIIGRTRALEIGVTKCIEHLENRL